MLYVTKHAAQRVAERILELESTAYEWEKIMEFTSLFANDHINYIKGGMRDGTEYWAMIDGYDSLRALIRVKDGKHYLITVREPK